MALEHLTKAKDGPISIDERHTGSTVAAPEHFGGRSSRPQSVNAGSTVGAAPGHFGRRYNRSQSANNITHTHKSKQEEDQQVDKGFHWSGSRQQYQPEPFKPVIRRPTKKSARIHGSVLQKLRKETGEKKH